MSLLPTAARATRLPIASGPPAPAPVARRVRHQARDVAVMMAFSAASSVAVAAGLLLLAHLSSAGR